MMRLGRPSVSKRGNINEKTCYLGADLDIELSSALAGKLLLTSELEQRRDTFHMGGPIAKSVPTAEIDGLYAGEERLLQYQTKMIGVLQMLQKGSPP